MKRGDPTVPVVAGQGYGRGDFATGEEATANTLLARAGQAKVAVCRKARSLEAKPKARGVTTLHAWLPGLQYL